MVYIILILLMIWVFLKLQLLLNQNIKNMKKTLLFLFTLAIFNVQSQCVVDTDCTIEPAPYFMSSYSTFQMEQLVNFIQRI